MSGRVQSGGQVQFIDASLFAALKEKALASPRLRANHNFHASYQDNPQRFLNVLARGTYVPPHCHNDPPKAETLLILEGRAAFFLFDDEGNVTQATTLGENGPPGVDIAPGVWHSLVVLTPFTVVFEIKAGPFLGACEKVLPPWAPQEGDPAAAAYNESLLRHLPPGA